MNRKNRSLSKISLSLAALAAAFVAGASVPPAAAFTYDFEALPLNRVLNGNDGWLSEPTLGEVITRQDGTSVENGTQLAQPLAGVASGFFAFLTRVNDPYFRFSPFFGTETAAVIEFEATAEAAAGVALGRDINGDGLLSADLGERGPIFGTFREAQQGVPNFIIHTAAGSYLAPLTSAQRCCNLDSDWYRLRFSMDLAANGGAGAGSLHYMNLSLGDTEYHPVAELQNVSLELDSMLPAAPPSLWNAMFLVMRFDGSQNMPSLDNVVPHVPVVLENDMTLNIQALDAQPFGAKYDLILEPVAVPGDPTGLYWELARYQRADPNTPSTSSMLTSWDLSLDQVDVVDALPLTDTVSDVSLVFRGWDGVDPHTMLWELGTYSVP